MLGDSLTRGFYLTSDDIIKFHPYILQLRKMLESTNIKLVERGIPGEMTGEMLTRIEKDLEVVKPTFVIILGNLNKSKLFRIFVMIYLT